jgi:transketolase
VLRSSDDDQVTVVAAGITVPEALAAADRLAQDGVSAQVIDLYSVKPLDSATLVEAVRRTQRVITVEDHWPEGGLGEAVFASLAEAGVPFVGELLAVHIMPGSATPEEELADVGIDSTAITDAVRGLLDRSIDQAGGRRVAATGRAG